MQSMINYQSTSRNQRSKGFKVKQGLQFALLLAVSIWLLYQIMHSHDEKKNYVEGVQSKFSNEAIVILGRKGNVGLSNDRGGSDLEDVNLMAETEKKKDGGAGDDELDRNPEEKAEEESYIKENERVATHEGKEDQRESERDYSKLQNNEGNNGVEAVNLNKDMGEEDSFNNGHDNTLGRATYHDEQGDEKDPERIAKEQQNIEKDHDSKMLNEVEAGTQNNEDKDNTKTEEKIVVQPGEMANSTALGQHEMEDGVHSFHDENGIPQDIKDAVESRRTESNDDQQSNLYQETISNSSNQSRMIETMPGRGEDLKSKEGSIAAYVEMENKSTVGDTRNGKTSGGEIYSETSGVSSVDHASETVNV